MTPPVQTGLLVLHGNRSELLAQTVFEWIARQPLRPLEQEVFLVQSNGVAEWLKMALASQAGIFAASRVELPGRFLWRAYRQVLGQGAVPAESVFDKLPLTWRLMRLLPECVDLPGFEPLAGFLHLGGLERRLQLAERLADLFDQYQVYRSDWLAAWAAGHDVLPRFDGDPGSDPARDPQRRGWAASPPLLPDQRWQAALWRALLAPLSEAERSVTRPQLQQRFLAALDAGAAPASPLPRRIVLFGMSHLPMATLSAMAALSAHCQVLLAVPNPCRYHWADILPGRELLRQQRRRHPLRGGRDLAALGLDEMHAHAHPLLAAWGRQGRDFVRQLDAFDDALAAQQRFQVARVDLFDDAPGDTLLEQVQARIRDLVPLAEHPHSAVDPADFSIVFHLAHGAQREVEILHDQLLALLAAPPGGQPLQPRDIVVMLPEIASFAPAIRSVFGQYPRGDARYIPFDIADLPERGNNPVLGALEWLLRLPQQRCGLSEIRDLLDVPAVAERFGLAAADAPRLALWLAGAGVRWGLQAEQRAELGLGSCGEQNSWLFGLRRMLLGYAVGEPAEDLGGGFSEDFADASAADIEPYAEVGGLDAALVGTLAALVDALQQWWLVARSAATPAQWGERGRVLIESMFLPTDERERQTVDALQEGLRAWLAACETAGFDAPVPLAVAREAWLTSLTEPGLTRRFRAGGVTFCTLLPMRAVPFEVVCLLGMNDGDYPRRSPRSDFDLMGLPGQARPGDRARRDDDRQLMLEALLSARRVLYLSWAGRSARDNSLQPPSVLVSQLRDYLAAGWGQAVLAGRTTEHPLQPFSRRYFEQVQAAPAAGQPLFTHAREWRVAHAPGAAGVGVGMGDPAGSAADLPPDAGLVAPLTLARLTRFLKNPVRDFFRQRLLVVFTEGETADADGDDEVFGLDALAAHGLLQELVDEGQVAWQLSAHEAADLAGHLARQVARIHRAGRLPMAEPGRRAAQWLLQTGQQMFGCWTELQALYPQAAPREPLRCGFDGLSLDDWLDGLRRAPGVTEPPVWFELTASRLCEGAGAGLGSDPAKLNLAPAKLIGAWVRCLVASACGVAVRGVIVGRDCSVTIAPLPIEQATAALQTLLVAWREGLAGPLPLAARTGLASAAGVPDPAPIYEGRSFSAHERGRGEGDEACLARQFPDYAALSADGRFGVLADALYGPLLAWVDAQVSFKLHAAPRLAGAAPAADLTLPE